MRECEEACAVAGVQCNGLPTYHAYRGLNSRAAPLHMCLTSEMMPDEDQMETRLAWGRWEQEPLRWFWVASSR